MEISIIQAALIGVLAYLGSFTSPWLLGCIGGWYVVGRPLISGMLIGLVLGDVQTGIIVGAAVQTVFIAMVTPGGTMPTDLNAASFIGVGLGIATMKSGGSVEAAVSIATAMGAVGIILHNGVAVLNTTFNEGSQAAIEKGDEKKFLRNHWLWPQLLQFASRMIPTFMVLYFGQGIAAWIIETFPEGSYVMRVLTVLGGLFPAIGVGLLVKNLVNRNSDLILIAFGFTLVAALGLNMVSLSIVAGFIAYLTYQKSGNETAEVSVEEDDDDLGEVL